MQKILFPKKRVVETTRELLSCPAEGADNEKINREPRLVHWPFKLIKTVNH
jgi:hypothetical protein